MLTPFLDLSLSNQHFPTLAELPSTQPSSSFIDPATEMPSAPKLEDDPLQGPFNNPDQQLRPPIKLFDKTDADAWNLYGMLSLSDRSQGFV